MILLQGCNHAQVVGTPSQPCQSIDYFLTRVIQSHGNPGLSFFLHLDVIPFAYHASKLLADTTIKRELMNYKKSLTALAIAAFSVGAQAQTEIQWWHSMGGALGEWVNDQAKDFNASQKDYKIVPTFKGGYDESMTAAIAAFRSGNAPTFCKSLRWAPPP